MSPAHLGARDRRALRVGGALLVPLLLLTFAVRPYQRAVVEARAELGAQRELLARERALLAAAAAYPELIQQAEARLQREAPRLFGGADPLLMTTALSQYLGERGRGSRVLVQEIRSRHPEPVDEGVLALTLEVRAVGDLEGLLTLLYALEAGPRLVRVERLTLERSAPPAGPADAQEPALTLSATVRGFALLPTRDGTPAPVAGPGEP